MQKHFFSAQALLRIQSAVKTEGNPRAGSVLAPALPVGADGGRAPAPAQQGFLLLHWPGTKQEGPQQQEASELVLGHWVVKSSRAGKLVFQ